jgi:hypothetical protein
MNIRSAKEVEETIENPLVSCFADWSTYEDDNYFYSFGENAYYTIRESAEGSRAENAEGYRAVTENVPRNYLKALEDSKWGDPARKEWSTLIDTKAIVEVDSELAKEEIRNGADLVILFPVYEEKIKEGETVFKVRLVGDGRTQYSASSTYSPTPSREEFLILVHIIAVLGWEYVLVDEKRAFLNAQYKGENKIYTRLHGGDKYFEVKGALYGLKTSPKDYNEEATMRLVEMGFKKMHMCSCIFVKKCGDGQIIIIYVFVDDYFVTGSNKIETEKFIEEFRKIVSTTEPEWDAQTVLGMKLKRDREKCCISLNMSVKIEELAIQYDIPGTKMRVMPMPQQGYIINDHEFETMEENLSRYLEKKEITQYLKIVGSLLWITGLRLDIIFSVMYLSWFTKKPRSHHMKMALYVVNYLYYSRDIPLVLGGKEEISIISYTDSSLGTGPNSRSVSGQISRLGNKSGGVYGKSTASHTVRLSSFESELDAATSAIKTVNRIRNILEEMNFIVKEKPILYSDNEAMINFVKGDGVAKGVRHMELRMWYTREQYKMGGISLIHMPGCIIPSDKFTKLANKIEHIQFRYNIQGLALLCDEKLTSDTALVV